ncbi:MAG: hypothetical protein ACOYL8_04785 [Patescibacteria group bacterium]
MEKFSNIIPQNTDREENKIEKPQVREGIDFLFEQIPELAKIGTIEQYSEYLDSVFPGSKLKDIVYHGNRDARIEKFDTSLVRGDIDRNFGVGGYFTPDRHRARIYSGSKTYDKTVSVILNLENPFIAYSPTVSENFGLYKKMEKGKNISDYSDNDGIIVYNGILPRVYAREFKDILVEYVGPKENGLPRIDVKEFLLPELLEVVAPKSEQIHILGSQEDIENFKKFTEK